MGGATAEIAGIADRDGEALRLSRQAAETTCSNTVRPRTGWLIRQKGRHSRGYEDPIALMRVAGRDDIKRGAISGERRHDRGERDP